MLAVQQQRLNLPTNTPLHFAAVWQMAVEGQFDTMASDTEVCMKQRCVTEFLHAEKIEPIDIHLCLLDVYGDQRVDVSTVRQWVVHFGSGDSNSKSPSLVQNFMSTACSLLFISGENAQLIVVTVFERTDLWLRFCSICLWTMKVFPIRWLNMHSAIHNI